MLLATHCGRLRGLFMFPHSLSVNESSSIAWINDTKLALRTASQGSQYTVDYAYDVN